MIPSSLTYSSYTYRVHLLTCYLLTHGDLGDRGDEPVELRLVEHALLQLLDGHGLRGVEHLLRVRVRVRVEGEGQG